MSLPTDSSQQTLAPFLWNIADLLLGRFRPSEYGRIILPFTVLRRLECVLEPTRAEVLEMHRTLQGSSIDLDLLLPDKAKAKFYNTSNYTLATLGSTSTRANLQDYIARFSGNARQVFDHFAFETWLEKLEKANLLYLVTQKFAAVDLHPNVLSNHEMGLVFEHLIRKFAESSNDDAGQYFTPRDVVRLTTTLVFAPDHEALTTPGAVRTIYDCAAGTGGFLSSGIELVHEWNPQATLVPYAQELNPETYAVAVADKLIQGYDTRNLKLGNTLSHDHLPNERFDYCLANPPFGVKWENVQTQVKNENLTLGEAGRFGAGLPRVGDGSLLFLMHLLSKRKSVLKDGTGGTRIGIVLSGSPLFNGGAGSGESEIRRWILEHDWLEAIVALPGDLFYNTGIGTYVWILSNKKEPERKGKVCLIDATAMHTAMRKSLGSKRKLLSEDQIAEIARLYEAGEDTPTSKVFPTTAFGYRRITVERPLRLRFAVTPETLETYRGIKGAESIEHFEKMTDSAKSFDDLVSFLKAAGVKKLSKGGQKAVFAAFGTRCPASAIVTDTDKKPVADADLREFENVPLGEDIHAYFRREVLPHVPDAWIDETRRDEKDGQVGIVGYEINFNRYFYQYQPPRLLQAIDEDLRTVEAEIAALLGQVTQ